MVHQQRISGHRYNAKSRCTGPRNTFASIRISTREIVTVPTNIKSRTSDRRRYSRRRHRRKMPTTTTKTLTTKTTYWACRSHTICTPIDVRLLRSILAPDSDRHRCCLQPYRPLPSIRLQCRVSARKHGTKDPVLSTIINQILCTSIN